MMLTLASANATSFQNEVLELKTPVPPVQNLFDYSQLYLSNEGTMGPFALIVPTDSDVDYDYRPREYERERFYRITIVDERVIDGCQKKYIVGHNHHDQIFIIDQRHESCDEKKFLVTEEFYVGEPVNDFVEIRHVINE